MAGRAEETTLTRTLGSGVSIGWAGVGWFLSCAHCYTLYTLCRSFHVSANPCYYLQIADAVFPALFEIPLASGLGPPVVPFYQLFLGSSPTKIDKTGKMGPTYSNLKSGGPSQHKPNRKPHFWSSAVPDLSHPGPHEL